MNKAEGITKGIDGALAGKLAVTNTTTFLGAAQIAEVMRWASLIQTVFAIVATVLSIAATSWLLYDKYKERKAKREEKSNGQS